MKLRQLFADKTNSSAAARLYDAVVAQARMEGFYARAGVPDTVDGRFELITLHAFIVLRRLKADYARTKDLGQALFDYMFEDMDRSLREMGAGDLGVGRRVKTMASGFYGRISAYENGLAGDDEALHSALLRNLYGTVEPDSASVAVMAAYLRAQIEQIDSQPLELLIEGEVVFGPPIA